MAQTNLRFTPQRKAIIEVLHELDTHPTADDLYERVRKKMPKISLGTIYRNLDILYHQGIIQKLHVAESQMRFDGNPDFHYHIHCTQCGSIADIFNCPDISFVMKELETDFTITDYSLIFHGLCPDCTS
ncbi:MAG: transcriptional repressor [Desulfohalobiaceae bacterium]